MGPKVSWKNSGAGIVSRGETIWTDLCEAIAVLVMLEKMVLKSVAPAVKVTANGSAGIKP